MIVDLKYFYENPDSDFEEYDKLWDANRDRMIFFQQNSLFTLKQQGETIVYNIDKSKDILAIRFPNKNIFKNKIIKDIIRGKGFIYGDKIWYPKEVWIYSPQF
jgi:hypothetical protein